MKKSKKNTSINKAPKMKISKGSSVNPKISLCMIVKNEEKFLKECLESAKNLVDEMIIVDTGSTDSTVKIAEKYEAKIFFFEWNDSFSDARNESLKYATGDWIIQLDADERLLPESIRLIKQAVKSNSADAYVMPIISRVTDNSADSVVSENVRLWRNAPEHRFKYSIHESISESLMENKATIWRMDAPILHLGYHYDLVSSRDKKNRNITLLEKELAKNPNDKHILYQLCQEYYSVDQFEKSLEYAKQLENLITPDDHIAQSYYTYYINALNRTDRYFESLQVCNKAIINGITGTGILFGKAHANLNLKNLDEAIRLFEEVKKADLDSFSLGDKGIVLYKADAGIAVAYYGKDDFQKAIEYAQKAYSTNPDLINIIDLIAKSYFKLGDFDKAAEYANIVLSKDANYEDAKKILSLIEEEKQKIYAKHQEINPNTPEGLLQLGMNAEQIGDYDNAEKHYTQAIAIDKTYTQAYSNLARVKICKGDLENAIDLLSEAIKLDPNCWEAFSHSGDILFLIGNYSGAEAAYQRCLSLKSDCPNVFTALGHCYLKMGALDSAIMAFRQALNIDSQNSDAKKALELLKAA
ncbi:MAG: glycosyltransferase [Armatimonadota bacterium]